MIVRSYSCLNRRCQHAFDSTLDHPPCPLCRGLRVQWVPKPVAIRGSRMAAIDATARGLADDFGLTNFRTPEAGKPAALAPPAAPNKQNIFEPQKGWRIAIPDDALTGGGHAVCAPAGVTAKVKVDPNAGPLKETNAKYGMDEMRRHTRIEATHRPKG